jgi:aryl-alcohol dehydrogenase-like predicted oxidoreductase
MALRKSHPLKYVNLGDSGTLVSQICIGGWQLPGTGERDVAGVETVNIEELARILKKAVDHGVNFIDTANRYHGRMSPTDLDHAGGSERAIGRVMKRFEREAFVIATKVRAQMRPWPNGEGLSRKHVLWQIAESLKRLDMDYVDLYQLHAPDSLTPKLEILKTLSTLVERGVVRYVGESNYPTEEVSEMMEVVETKSLEPFVSMQELYNVLQRGVEAKFALARKHKMLVLAYSPLAQGLLAGRYLPGREGRSRASYAANASRFFDPAASKAVAELELIAKEKDVSLAQLALAWLLKKQESLGVTIVPVVGITKSAQLDDDIEALNVKLDSDGLNRIEEVTSRAHFNPVE